MKKYKFIGIMMVMVGNGNLSSELLEEQSYNVEPEPWMFVSSLMAIVLGFYFVRLANKKSTI
ncbi:MAG: hypothetical protein EOO10_14640 [Chitinophagaceae bacterium]|nr:MAG: hypothetical protein EOO10_14640 [Chitinophagaceae bacterium]